MPEEVEQLCGTLKGKAMTTDPQEEGSTRVAGRQGPCQRLLMQARNTVKLQKGWALCTEF